MCGVNNTGTLTVSDNNSNTYTTAKSQTGVQAGALISFAVNVNAGATTFTCNCGTVSSNVCAITAYEVSGLLAQAMNQPDQTDANAQPATTLATFAGNMRLTDPNELAFAALMLKVNTTVTPGSGWVADTVQGATGGRLTP